jgi:hypothetical protein
MVALPGSSLRLHSLHLNVFSSMNPSAESNSNCSSEPPMTRSSESPIHIETAVDSHVIGHRGYRSRSIDQSPVRLEALSDRVLGATITGIEALDDGRLRVEFEQDGTGGAGCITFAADDLCFCPGGCGSCWRADAEAAMGLPRESGLLAGDDRALELPQGGV